VVGGSGGIEGEATALIQPPGASAPVMHSEAHHIVDAFKTWDEEGSGVISKKELSNLIRTLTPDVTDEDIEKLFIAASRDGLAVDDFQYEAFIDWLWAVDDGDLSGSGGRGADIAADKAGDGGGGGGQPIAATGKEKEEEEKEDEIDEEARRRGLWEGALASASSRAMERYPKEQVRQYFDEVRARLEGQDYALHVQGTMFDRVDADHDGKISFQEATALISKSLQCVADITGTGRHPTMEDVRFAFDSHDTLAIGRGIMGVDEFLNLMRYLQVCVAEAAMPMSRVFRQD